MDLPQAKLILCSFRPNGSDLHDPAFAQALELAATHEELGQWLATERAQDLAFAESLAEVPIPENLRENIFTVFATANSAPGYDQFDHGFAGALADLQPPASLRGEILAAMEIEQQVTALPTSAETAQAAKARRKWFSLPGIGIAAAAGIVAALVWTTLINPASPHRTIAGQITPVSLQQEAISFLDSKFILDRTNSKQEALYQFLASNELPSPQILPAGLQKAEGVGCKRLDFNNKAASLICYQQSPNEPVVHLVVMRRNDVEGELPLLPEAKENCTHCNKSGWSVASWRDEDKAFFLLGKMEPEQFAAIF